MRTFSFALGVFATPTILLIKPRLSPRKAQGNNNEDRVRDSTADEEQGEEQHVSAPADFHARDADKVSNAGKGSNWSYMRSSIFLSVVSPLY